MAVYVAVLLLTCHALATFAATHTFDWNITWVTANPDGAFERLVIGINGQWPLDVLNFTKGDRVVANVHNMLGNQSTSMHFHGLFQNGTSDMDGPPGVTQCEMSAGSTFVYNFTVDQTGSYWYHSHTRGQYPDGLRQAFFVDDPSDPYKGQYDEEVVLTLSDWYHEQMPTLIKGFISVLNPTGAEPVPNAALLNDTQNLTVSVQPGKTYLFRIVNVGAFASQYFWIEGHSMRIVEVDGVWTNASETDMIYLTAAQRCSVLVTTKPDTGSNFAMVGSMDTDLFDTIPEGLNPNVTGWLQYDLSQTLPQPQLKDTFDPFDDFNLIPVDGQEALGPADHTVTLDMKMDNLGDGANYAFFNEITYVAPKVPSLYSALSTGGSAVNPTVYGTDTNAFVLKKGDVVDIIVNNDDPGKHPFHLHGHAFQVLARSDDDVGHWNSSQAVNGFPQVPMRRDTLMVRPQGNFLIRFVADNPGVWFFHCHIYWHLVSGLAAVMVEAPLELQSQLSIPSNHYEVCNAGGVPYLGNAAANTENYFDLEGENRSVAPLPPGFTTGGIVALVFSCVAAFLGLATIAWYGAAPL